MGRGKTGNFWKAAAILLGCALLTGCGNTGEVDDYATNIGYEARGSNGTTQVVQSESGSSATTQTAGIPKEEIKVGVLHLSDPAEGSGYTYTHDLGIQGMQQNLGLSDDQIIRKINVNDSDTQETRQAIQECIDEGCNIIFTTSWGYMETTAEMAEEYPDVYFSHGTGYLSNGKNFNNYFGRIYQARYLSGIVAGMNTSSNKIGYVAAMDSSNSEVTGGIDAFALGIYSVNPDAKVYVKVTNSWYDPEGEKAAAQALLDMGCDVIAQHCDTVYPQTLAQEKGVYSIGYNSDMSKETPKATLTSVLWTWSAYYTSYVQSIMDGTYDGSNYYGGMSEGLIGLSGLASFNDNAAQDKIDEAKQAILDGSVKIFENEMKTNTGKVIGKDGSVLDDATITGKINWYYHNVKVLK